MLGGHIKQVKILTRQKTGIVIVDVMSLSHRRNIFRQLCALNWILEGMSQDQQPPVMPPITSCWKLKYVPGSCQFCFSWGLSIGFFVAIILKLIYYYNKIFTADALWRRQFPAREMMSRGTRVEILYWTRFATQAWIVHPIGSKFASTMQLEAQPGLDG